MKLKCENLMVSRITKWIVEVLIGSPEVYSGNDTFGNGPEKTEPLSK